MFVHLSWIRRSAPAVVCALALLTVAAEASAQADSTVVIEQNGNRLYPLDLINFPDTVAGTSSNAIEFRIRNTGVAPVTLPQRGAVLISGSQASAFSVTRLPGVQLGENGDTYFDIVFSPTQPGYYSADVTVTTSDAVTPHFRFVVAGFCNPDSGGG